MKRFSFLLTLFIFTVATSVGQSVQVQGNFDLAGSVKRGWVDVTDTTAYTAVAGDSATVGDYGIAMYDNGVKTITLPIIDSTTRGTIFVISNESLSGNITLSSSQTIYGPDDIPPGRTARIEATTFTKWVVQLY